MTTRATLYAVGTVLAGLGAGVFSLPAAAQSDGDVRARLQRLERDVRDLQAETFGGRGPAAGAGLPSANAGPGAGATDLQRSQDIEESLRRLTGQIEELSFQVNQLGQRVDRLQRDVEFQAGNRGLDAPAGDLGVAAAAEPPGDGGAPRALTNDAPPPARGLAPASGSLGTLPPDSPLPLARPGTSADAGGDAKAEFDSAMNLLARAQYDAARDAFRTVAENYPETEEASQALYWTGDIAYSAKKSYPDAARDFAELLKRYPDAARAPDGMLKLGLSLIAMGQKQEGCATLAALPAKYPRAGAALTGRARTERRTAGCA